MNILGIDNIIINATDLDQARRFYGTILGLPEHFAFPDLGIVGYSIGAERPGLMIHVSADNPPTAKGCGPRIWLEVADVRREAEALADSGIVPLAPPFHVKTGWTVEIPDPFGNVIGLTDYTSAPDLAREP